MTMNSDEARKTIESLNAVGSPVERQVRRSRRYGRFTVPARWADEYRSELLRVMGKCIVFRAEHLYHSECIEYWAASDHFRALQEGEIVPEYQWYFTDDGDFWCEELRA
jgi:hypothetical protein